MRRHAVTLAMLNLLAAALPVVGCASGATSSTSADATAPPLVTRTLRFETPADLDAWVIHGGEWKVEDGHAVGRSLYPATERYSWLTYRTFYGEIRRVVVHAALDGGSAGQQVTATPGRQATPRRRARRSGARGRGTPVARHTWHSS